MSTEVLPARDELSDSVMLELSDCGGHVGFVADNGLLPTMWLQPRIHRFLLDQDLFATSNQPGLINTDM